VQINRFILRDECEFPPGTEGTIVITVDGDERKTHGTAARLVRPGRAIGPR
jgi:hypothetical protein